MSISGCVVSTHVFQSSGRLRPIAGSLKNSSMTPRSSANAGTISRQARRVVADGRPVGSGRPAAPCHCIETMTL